MYTSRLKFSIITVCFNAEHTIALTLRSVQAQQYENFEHLVIDGASTDATQEVVHNNAYGKLNWHSEPDNGIYDAMNKGLQRATGDVIFFLNADDRFCEPNVLQAVAGTFVDSPELRLVYGDVFIECNSRLVSLPQPKVLTRKILAATTVCHQALFIHRDAFKELGAFRTEFSVVSDWDWIYKAVFHNQLPTRHMPKHVAVIGAHGVSHSVDFESEKWRALRQYYTPFEIYVYRLIPRKLSQARRTTRSFLRRLHKNLRPLYKKIFVVLNRLLSFAKGNRHL